jgi:hypothetical protein
MIEPRKYTLTLSPDYVLSWGFWEAVRELLQNSIDQHAVNSDSTPVFEYEPGEELLVLGNEECVLHPRSLLLGQTTKHGSKKTIGQFGEGYKLALLVLTRLSYHVLVRNGDAIWRPRFEFNEEFGEHVLTVQVTPADEPINGIRFEIRDVSQDDYAKLCENYIPGYAENQILDELHLRKRVFVHGLFVCKLDALTYGYNFASDRIRLDRDRGMADSFNVKWEASQLWQRTANTNQLYDALAEGIADVEYVSHLPAASKNAIVERFQAEHPDAIPVMCQAEIDRRKGQRTQLVPAALGNLLSHLKAFVFDKSGTPAEWLERFAHQYRNHLPIDGQEELDAILEASREWCGVVPASVTKGSE